MEQTIRQAVRSIPNASGRVIPGVAMYYYSMVSGERSHGLTADRIGTVMLIAGINIIFALRTTLSSLWLL
jgi:hypothetical protein